MDTVEYFVKLHPSIKNQDLPELPDALKADFEEFFKPVLKRDPYDCSGNVGDHFEGNHFLNRGPLLGFYAMEIKYQGIAYRLVYGIEDTLENMRVDVISFALHDPAYDKAVDRTLNNPQYKYR